MVESTKIKIPNIIVVKWYWGTVVHWLWDTVPNECSRLIHQFRTSKFLTQWHMQTVQIQIRLLLKEQSDQGLHYLPFH